MNKVKLLVPYGLDRLTGRMLHVDKVPNGKDSGVVCPSCKFGLVAKNAGTHKTHHFAHAGAGDNAGACEGWLHGTAKWLLYERIQDALADGSRILIQWKCQNCPCLHKGNLLKGVTTIRKEAVVPGANIRPDILLEKDGQPVKLVEIVVTHPPEAHVYEYARAKRIPLVVFELKDASGCDALQSAPTLDVQIKDTCDTCRCSSPCSFWGVVPSCCTDSRWHREKSGECVEGQRGHGHCGFCGGPLILPGERQYGHHLSCLPQERLRLTVLRARAL